MTLTICLQKEVHPFWLVADLVVAFLISFGLVKSKSKNLKSVKKQESAEAYERKGPCRFEDQLTVLSTGLSLKELLEMKKTVLPVPLAEAHHIQVLPAVPTAEPAANSDNG